jgi:hypothetical protein
LGTRARTARRKRPCQKLAQRVLPPLLTLALLRTISEIMGRPPIRPAAVLPMPMASRSLLKSDLRLVGVEGVDRLGAGERLDAADQGEEDDVLERGDGPSRWLKSGKVMASTMWAGSSSIRWSGPRWYSAPKRR